MLALLPYFGKVCKDAEEPDRCPLDLKGLSGGLEAELCHLFIGVNLLAAHVIGLTGIRHVLHDEGSKVRTVDHIGLNVTIPLQQLHLTLFHIGSEHLRNIIEVSGGTVDDPVHITLLYLLLHHVFGVEHGNLFGSLFITAYDRDIVELPNSCLHALSVEIHVSLIVDVIGCEVL